MDGYDLSRRLAQLLNEEESAGWLDLRSTYDFLYEAAIALVDRTGCLKTTQTITTLADTSEYNLDPDYLRLYLRNNREELIIKYNDGTNDHFLTWKDYEDIVYSNETTSVSVPSHFAIIDAALPDQVTGSATADGAATAGLCQLSGAGFGDIGEGSTVHNTTDGSTGVVVKKTSSTVLQTALFGGTDNDWTSGDSYVIQPQGRLKLVLDRPCSTAGHTITVYHVQRPLPVYHQYGAYRIPMHYQTAMLKYALWLYKYRDKAPDTANSLYQFWELETRKAGNSFNRATRPNNVTVNFMRRHG